MVICVDAGSSEEEEKVEKDEDEEENAVARAKDLDARQQEVEQQEKLESTYTITERCRSRVEWAEKLRATSVDEFKPCQDSDRWCSNFQTCTEHEICRIVKAIEDSISDHAKAKQNVVEDQQSLLEAQQRLAEAQPHLAEAQQRLAEAQQRLAEAQPHVNMAQQRLAEAQQRLADDELVNLLKTIVQDKENALQDKETIVQDKKNAVQDKKNAVQREETIVQKDKNTVQDKETIVKGKEISFMAKCDALVNASNDLLASHELVKCSLTDLAKAGNRTRHTLAGTRASAQSAIAANTSIDKSRLEVIPPSPGATEALLDSCEALVIPEHNAAAQKNGTLSLFCNFLQTFLPRCVVSRHVYETDEFKADIAKTVQAIWNWEPHRNPRGVYYRPSGKAQETKGAHPILFAIMQKIASIGDFGTRLTHEQFIPATGQKSRRFIDGMTDAIMEHLRATMAAFLGIPIEIKPLSRANETFEKLLEGAENQVIGHCMQILLDRDFNFGGGLGRNGKVRGVALTMISIEIVEVELRDVGTKDVRLVVRKTGHLPLFDVGTTQHLMGPQKQSAIDSATQMLFREPSVVSMQSGFHALISILDSDKSTCPNLGIGFLSGDGDTTEISLTLDSYLGSGAFSRVYSIKHDNCHSGIIVKVPKSIAAAACLRNELAMLQALGFHPGIPSPCYHRDKNLHSLHLAQRCERSSISCLQLKADVGSTALDALMQVADYGGSTRPKLLENVVVGVIDALAFAHGRNPAVLHLDIRPSNIIVSSRNDGSIVVQLIDWGCAAVGNEKLSHYRGCPPYSHDSLLLGKPKGKPNKWTPKIEHDNASFAFTVAHLAAFAKAVPWPDCDGLDLQSSVLDKRRDIALELIKKANLPASTVGANLCLKEKLIDYIYKRSSDRLKAARNETFDESLSEQPSLKRAKTK